MCGPNFYIENVGGKILREDRKMFAAFMDLEKAYNRFDRKGLWDNLTGHLLQGIRSFSENASVSVRVKGELSESFSVEVGVRQGCIMSPWLFNIYMDGCIREVKVGVWDNRDIDKDF